MSPITGQRLSRRARLLPAAIFMILGLAIVAGPAGAGGTVDTWTTTTRVPLGQSLTIVENTPNVNIATSSPVFGCTVSGTNTNVVTYTCLGGRGCYSSPDAVCTANGIPAGTQLTQTFSTPGGGPVTSNVSETATYNSATFPTQFAPSACGQAGAEPFIQNWKCTISVPAMYAGEIFTAYLLADDKSLLMDDTNFFVDSLTGNTPHGINCFIHGSVIGAPGPSNQGQPTVGSDGNLVQPMVSVASPQPVFGKQWAGEIAIPFSCDVVATQSDTQTLELDAASSLTTNVSIGALLTGGRQPSTQTLAFGANPAVLTSISPATGSGGTAVTLAGTGLTAFMVTFGGAPPSAIGGSSGGTIGASRGTSVSFGSTPAAGVSCSSDGTSCTATAPPGISGTTVNVTVTNSAGTSNPLTFTYSQ